MINQKITIAEILSLAPVIPVLAIADVDKAVPLARALVAGGLRVIEITLRTACALDAIRQIAESVDDAIVGAGTVLSPQDLEKAKHAGARFAVSPGATQSLLSAAQKGDLPFLPGVATPSEIIAALDQGFSHLKFFPAEAAGGIPMLKSFAGPFPGVVFCPTGGIREDNLEAYLALTNVACVGGTWLAPAEALASNNWEAVRALAERAMKLAEKTGC